MSSTSNRSRYQRRRHSPLPANNSVRRTYDLLRSSLASFEPDTVLVENDLVELLSASRNTVRVVLQMLAAEGLVCRGPKVGTHVGSSIVIRLDQLVPPAELGTGRAVHFRADETSKIAAPRLVAERLEVAYGSMVWVNEGLLLDGTTPVALCVSYVPLTSSDDGMVNLQPVTDTITFLEQQLDVSVASAETRVVAVVSDAQTSALLDIEQGEPLLFIEDLLLDADGLPRAISHFRFRSDGVMLSVTAWRQRAQPTADAIAF